MSSSEPMEPIPPEKFYGRPALKPPVYRDHGPATPTPPHASEPSTPPSATPAPLPHASEPSTPPPSTPPPRSQEKQEEQESPVKFSASGFNPFTSMHFLKNERNRQLELECRGKFVGPMPPANFLKEFLGEKQLKQEIDKPFEFTRTSKIHLTKAQNKKGEVSMYPHLIKALQECCPQLQIRDTHNDAHESEWARKGTKVKPDITAYDKDASLARPMDLTKAEITVEVKIDPGDDAFLDSPSGEATEGKQSAHENPTIQGGDTRGQITTYATAQLAAQYRTHAFSVLIIKDKARLIRWDRAGAIFTSLFDYRKTDYLMKFFYRYNYATSGARGLDESVTIPHDLDDELVSEARKALGCSPNDPLYRFEVVDETPGERSGKVNYYLGGAPTFKGTKSLTGRSTRGIVVYDIQNRKVAYLKDTWRVCGTEYEVDKEGETYRKLNAARVRNVPTILAYGDVGNDQWHRTQTDIFARRGPRPLGQLRGHRHSRLVLKEVGRDLTSFETVAEVVSAMADAVQAHSDAYELAGILHRDISVGNILITDNGGGLLIDWDLSKPKSKMGIARQPERTGTWQFMSARLLLHPPPSTHVLADDHESFYHVLVWVALRYTPHAIEQTTLEKFIHRNFDESWNGASGTTGGDSKRAHLLNRDVKDIGLPQGELDNLIDDLASVLRFRYERLPTQEPIDDHVISFDLLKSNPQALEKAQKALYALHYDTNIKRLETSDWIRKRFRHSASLKDQLTQPRVIHKLNQPDMPLTGVRKESEALRNDNLPIQSLKYGHNTPQYDEEAARGSKRTKQAHESNDGDQQATWAPGAPEIISGRVLFPEESVDEDEDEDEDEEAEVELEVEEEDEEDEGYVSAWEHEPDETTTGKEA